MRRKVSDEVSGIGQGRHFVPLAASPHGQEHQSPEQQAVGQQPTVVGPMVEHLRVRQEVTRHGERNRPFSDPPKIRVDEDDVRQVGEHPEAKADLATVLDVLWRTLADDQAEDGVRGRVHRFPLNSSNP